MASVTEFLRAAEPIYTELAVSVVIVLLGLVIGRMLGKLVQKILMEIEFDRLVKMFLGLSLSLQSILGSVASYAIYAVFLFWALRNLGMESVLFKLLVIAAIAILALSLVLALKDFVPNLSAGIIIHMKGLLRRDDHVEFDRISGRVLHLDLLSVHLQTKSKDTVIIPNSIILKGKLTKLARSEH